MEAAPAHRGFDLHVNEGKVEAHLVSQYPDNAIKVATQEPLLTNRWQHLFVTYDGSRKAAAVNVYVDGQPRALDKPIDKLSATIDTEAPLLIGTRTNAFPSSPVRGATPVWRWSSCR